MYDPNSTPFQSSGLNNEIDDINAKRRRLSNILRIITFIFLLGDWIGFSYIFGIPTFVIGIILIFTRGLIVRKVYGTPQQVQNQNMNANMYGSGMNNIYANSYTQHSSQADPLVDKVYAELKFCPSCGEQNEMDSMFCESCGTKF